jgi:hypothetical protein
VIVVLVLASYTILAVPEKGYEGLWSQPRGEKAQYPSVDEGAQYPTYTIGRGMLNDLDISHTPYTT